MRELKFRTWDTKRFLYVYFGDWEIDEEWSSIAFPSIEKNDLPGSYNGLKKSDYILEQFTDLKDKNGRDIYEGDIIRLPEDTYDGVHYPNAIVQVEWTNEFVGFGPFVYWIYGYSSIDPNKCEIIGNIHESPELLK